MVESLRFFERSGLFQRTAETTGGIEHIAERIENRYRDRVRSLLRRTDGDQAKADYLANKTYFEYYWDLENYNAMVKELEEERKRNKQ